MAVSTKFTDVQAFRDYVQDFAEQLIGKAFFKASTLNMITNHDGVKGKLTLTELILGDLIRRWNATFAPVADTLEFTPRHLDVEAARLELQIVPQQFEESYLGYARRASFNNVEPLPFEGYIMMQVMAKAMQEIETAIWQADPAGAPAATDALIDVISGFLNIIADDQAGAAVLTPVTTSGGAITTSNVITLIESMWDGLDPAYQDMPVGIFVAPHVWKKYQVAYRENYGKYTDPIQNGRMKLDFCDAELIRTPGMGSSSRVVMTPIDNLHVGYDGLQGESMNFEQNHRALDYWWDFKLGCQIGIYAPGVVVINDLA